MNVHGSARFVVLGAMSLLYFLLSAGTFNALGVVLPVMVPALGMNWAQAGLGFTLLGVATGIASLVPAILIRRIGVSLTLIAGAILLAIGFSCLMLARDALPYHIGTTLIGFGYCFCGTVAGVHVISGLFERPSTPIGIYFTLGGAGSVAGPLVFVAVQSWIGDWRAFWLICTVLALVAGAFAAIVTRGSRVKRGGDDATAVNPADWSVREALATPQYWLIVASYSICLTVNITIHSFAAQHFSERGLSHEAAASVISFGALISTIAAASAGVIGEKVHARWLMLGAQAARAIALAAIMLPQNWATLGTYAVMIGLGISFNYVSTAVLLRNYFGARANLVLYSTMCMVSTLAAAGPVIGGYVRDQSGHFLPVFATLAVVTAALIVVVLAMRPPTRANKAGGEPEQQEHERGAHYAPPLAEDGARHAQLG